MFGIGDVVGAVSDVADFASDIANGDIAGALDNVADLAQAAAPFVSMVNPVAGMALQAGGQVLDKLVSDQAVQSFENVRDFRKPAGTGGGGSVLREIAQIMGQLAGDKIDELKKGAGAIGSGGDGANILQQSFELQGIAQELGALSKAATEAISSIGNAQTTAISK